MYEVMGTFTQKIAEQLSKWMKRISYFNITVKILRIHNIQGLDVIIIIINNTLGSEIKINVKDMGSYSHLKEY